MQAERARILEMLRDGRVSVEQAEQLLEALGKAQEHEQQVTDAGPARPPQSGQGGPALAGGLAQLGKTIAGQVAAAFGGGRGGRWNFGTTCLTKDGLARMEDGSSYTNLGKLTIAEDVTEDLLDRKIASFTNLGEVTGPPKLFGILEARCRANFGEFGGESTDNDSEGETEVTNLGQTILTPDQLRHMPDGVTYTNLGKLHISEGISEDLLIQKIGVYKNFGKTTGPARLLGVLQARCPENFGQFLPTDLPDDDNDDDDNDDE